MEATHSMFVPPSQRTIQKSVPLSDPGKEAEKLDEKYRPRRFSEMVGQSYATMFLMDFCDNPFSQVFLFSGDTGLGKTTAAKCLARELGVSEDWNFLQIRSGELNDEAIEVAFNMLRQVGMADGWKVVLCDEGDLMSVKARGLWLSRLEDLPRKSVIIFTTNNLEKFDQRLIDRCEHIPFESNARVLRPDAQSYLNRLWVGEGLAGNPPNVEDCKGVILQNVVSFRRIARFVESEMRKQSAKLAQNVVQAGTKISLAEHNARKGVRL